MIRYGVARMLCYNMYIHTYMYVYIYVYIYIYIMPLAATQSNNEYKAVRTK